MKATFTPTIPAGWSLYRSPARGSLVYAIDPFNTFHECHWREAGEDDVFAIPSDMIARLIAVGFGSGPQGRAWNSETLTVAFDALPTYRKELVAPRPLVRDERVQNMRQFVDMALTAICKAEARLLADNTQCYNLPIHPAVAEVQAAIEHLRSAVDTATGDLLPSRRRAAA